MTATTVERPVTAQPATFLRRAEVAARAGISKTQVRRLEGTLLHPVIGPKGVRLFSEDEVQSLVGSRRRHAPERFAGDVAADVFRALDGGAAPKDIVVALRLDPQIVKALCSDWADMQRGFLIAQDDLDDLAAALLVDRPATGTELLEAIHGALRAARANVAQLREELRSVQIKADSNALVRELMGLPGSPWIDAAEGGSGSR